MSKRDNKSSESDWHSNPSHNTGRDYPAKRSVKVSTVLGWVVLAVAVIVMVKAVGGA